VPGLSTNNPVAVVVVALAILFLGVGGRGALIALRKDRREAEADQLTLTDLMRATAADTVRGVREEMDEMRRRYDDRISEISRDLNRERSNSAAEIHRLNVRIAQLEEVIRTMGGTVPPWPNLVSPQ
jgi:hypothetical protein